MGPKCEEFEQKLAERYERKHCVTVNSATAALHLALKAHGIGPGDEVILPALTFVSTALAVEYCGAKPVFADVSPKTLCIDWDSVGECCSVRTAAVIPVDYAGYPAMEGEPDSVLIVQDAAHSCGGIGYGDLICLSFHPVKPLATGDGGAILTDNDEEAERLRSLRWCGIDKSTWERARQKYGWDYSIQAIGYKYHWNDLQAAIGLAQLERLDEMTERRRQIATCYTAAFKPLEGRGLIQCPAVHDRHTWHLYVIRVDADARNQLIDHLTNQGISAGVHYKPLTHYRMWQGQRGNLPVTEREWQRMVSLPIYPDMTEEEQLRVINAVREFFEQRQYA